MMGLVENNLWENVLRTIKTKLQGERFETWFHTIWIEGIDNARRLIRLRAPNQVVQEWVKVNYASLIDQSFGELSLGGYAVDWVIPGESFNSIAQGVLPAETNELSVVREGSKNPDLPLPPVLPEVTSSAISPPVKQFTFDPGLNSKYTFDSFVVGSCNQFAHAASLAVVEAPGKT